MFSMKNILIKFKFQLSRAKVNVKVAVLRNMLLKHKLIKDVAIPMLSMNISLIGSCFRGL